MNLEAYELARQAKTSVEIISPKMVGSNRSITERNKGTAETPAHVTATFPRAIASQFRLCFAAATKDARVTCQIHP